LKEFICVHLPFLSVAKNVFVFRLGDLGVLGGSILSFSVELNPRRCSRGDE
jgi:hypothetical protein